jgi:hypothetical protein
MHLSSKTFEQMQRSLIHEIEDKLPGMLMPLWTAFTGHDYRSRPTGCT